VSGNERSGYGQVITMHPLDEFTQNIIMSILLNFHSLSLDSTKQQ